MEYGWNDRRHYRGKRSNQNLTIKLSQIKVQRFSTNGKFQGFRIIIIIFEVAFPPGTPATSKCDTRGGGVNWDPQIVGQLEY